MRKGLLAWIAAWTLGLSNLSHADIPKAPDSLFPNSLSIIEWNRNDFHRIVPPAIPDLSDEEALDKKMNAIRSKKNNDFLKAMDIGYFRHNNELIITGLGLNFSKIAVATEYKHNLSTESQIILWGMFSQLIKIYRDWLSNLYKKDYPKEDIDIYSFTAYGNNVMEIYFTWVSDWWIKTIKIEKSGEDSFIITHSNGQDPIKFGTK